MARGPDGQGGGAGFSLKDQLFNADTVRDLANEHSVLPGFDGDRFVERAVKRFPELGLLERLEWMADCLSEQLPSDFPAMAEALQAAMPPPLDPAKTDNDFGRFIHALPGILAVRHGIETHRERALDLLHTATQRFSMEFYIRPFLNRWPDATLARLDQWTGDDNYHVRRLVSEGTRPRLPWARNITLDPLVPLRFLDALHADPTRYVTRSVSNHLNDLTRLAPDKIVNRLRDWQQQAHQQQDELDWMTRHTLRTAVKRGETPALRLLGYDPDVPVKAQIVLDKTTVARGQMIDFAVTLVSDQNLPVMIDYRIVFARPGGTAGQKVFKLKSAKLKANMPLTLEKRHRIKQDATTFQWHPGQHTIVLQINGVDRAHTAFAVV